jgi:hypothetical protein
MKLQIIETPDYILAVSDEEIKEGEICNYGKSLFLVESILHKSGPFRHLNPKIEIQGKFLPDMKVGKFDSMTPLKKIIAYQPKNNAPELNLLLLPEMVVEDDVEKFANKHCEEMDRIGNSCDFHSFIEGHKSATKVYSEKDLVRVVEYMLKNQISEELRIELHTNFDKGVFILSEYMKKIIQSLKPKTPTYFVAEMEYWKNSKVYDQPDTLLDNPVLKTTTINGKTYLVGTYLYE